MESKAVWEEKVRSGAYGWKCSYEEYKACYCPDCDK